MHRTCALLAQPDSRESVGFVWCVYRVLLAPALRLVHAPVCYVVPVCCSVRTPALCVMINAPPDAKGERVEGGRNAPHEFDDGLSYSSCSVEVSEHPDASLRSENIAVLRSHRVPQML